MHSALTGAGLAPVGLFDLPNSAAAITPLIGQIVIMTEARLQTGEIGDLYLFHNRPGLGAVYVPVSQRLLPLDKKWLRQCADVPWPTGNLPEVIGADSVEQALIREYLFISLFRACAESLASEDASRLAAMQRAEKNIADLLEDLNRSFHRQRQSSIDDELFDVVSGFEALAGDKSAATSKRAMTCRASLDRRMPRFGFALFCPPRFPVSASSAALLGNTKVSQHAGILSCSSVSSSRNDAASQNST